MPSENNINNTVPVFRHTLFFILGIMVSGLIKTNTVQLLAAFSVVFVFWILARVLKPRVYQLKKHSAFFIVALVFILGIAHSHFFQHNRFKQTIPSQATYTGNLSDITPKDKNRYQLDIRLNSAAIDDSLLIKINEKIVLYSSDSVSVSALKPGDAVIFTGKLFPITSNNNPGDFDYKNYMRKKGIRYQMYTSNPIIKTGKSNRELKTSASNFRQRLLEQYQKANIEGSEFAVLAALTLGEKSYLDRSIKSQFSNSGAMHVLAVSGLHVGIIFIVLSTLFKPMCVSRKGRLLRSLFIIALLWAYALITGLSPSVMRAATMFSFVVAGQSFKRSPNIYNTIAFSALVLLLLNPEIIYEIGFQLSYAAVLSIVYYQPRIVALLPVKNKLIGKIWALFAVSVAAQLGTLPFSLFYFNQFPIYFWMSNFVVIPAAAILLYSAVAFFALSFIPLVQTIIAIFINLILKAMIASIAFINALPGAVVTGISFDKPEMILLLTIIVLPAINTQSFKSKKTVVFLILIVLLTANSAIKTYQTHQQKQMIVYNTYHESLISIIDGKNHYYHHTGDSLSNYSKEVLSNASLHFNTNNPISFSDTENHILRHDSQTNTLFFEDIVVAIVTLPDKNDNSNSKYLSILTSDSKININKNTNMKLSWMNNGKLNYFRDIFNEQEIMLDTLNSALLINLSD